MTGIGARELMRRASQATDAAGLPEETYISYPIPVRREGRIAAALFAAVAVPTPDGRNASLSRPLARVFVDWEEGSLLSVLVDEDAGPVEEAEAVGPARPPELEGGRFEEVDEQARSLEAELLSVLDVLAPVYALGADDPRTRQSGRELLSRLVAAPTLALYRDLNPDFFRWLESGPTPTTTWTPSHAVPSGGLPAWRAPDPSLAPVVGLEPGLPLQVVETAGEWARVVASNGWTGWVDGRRLAPLG